MENTPKKKGRTKKPIEAVVPVEPQKEPQTPAISIKVLLGNLVLEGSGPTALAALQAIPKPSKIMSKAAITVSNGVRSRTFLYMPVRLRRLFYSSPSLQAVHAKTFGFN